MDLLQSVKRRASLLFFVCVFRVLLKIQGRAYFVPILCSCRKRYDRAEQEFIDAKMDLHQKSELKESLTEHLYTIIHQNEIRKAKKLTELMEKLQLEESDESSPVHIDLSGLPSMTLLNAIQTLESGSPVTSPTSLTSLENKLAAAQGIAPVPHEQECEERKEGNVARPVVSAEDCNPGSSAVDTTGLSPGDSVAPSGVAPVSSTTGAADACAAPRDEKLLEGKETSPGSQESN